MLPPDLCDKPNNQWIELAERAGSRRVSDTRLETVRKVDWFSVQGLRTIPRDQEETMLIRLNTLGRK